MTIDLYHDRFKIYKINRKVKIHFLKLFLSNKLYIFYPLFSFKVKVIKFLIPYNSKYASY